MGDNQKIIHERILDLITRRKWSKRKFAEICNIHPQHVNSYLDGTFGFENLLEGLANAGEDIFYLLTGKKYGEETITGLVKETSGEYMTSYSNLMQELNHLKEENVTLKAMIFDLQRDKEQWLKRDEKQSRTIQDLKDEIAELQKGMGKSPT